MAITPTERSILSQAREIILREACEQQAERDRMEQARWWADTIVLNTLNPCDAEVASTAAQCLKAAIGALDHQTRHSQDAIDHIEAMIGVR